MKYIILILAFLLLGARYEIPADKDVVKQSKQIALSQLGVEELTGRNDGLQVNEYQKSVGIPSGSPWCCAFEYWCYDSASMELALPNPLLKTGLANAEYNYAMKIGVQTSSQPQENDLIVWRETNSYSGHIERILQVMGTNTVLTIGGNVSNSVQLSVRHISSPLGRLHVRGLIGT